MKPVPGLCQRCGLRYPHKKLREEYLLNQPTGNLVCQSCFDPSHPQLDTRHVRTDDKQSVANARSDKPELEQSRRLFAFNPVGCAATSTVNMNSGRVAVRT